MCRIVWKLTTYFFGSDACYITFDNNIILFDQK